MDSLSFKENAEQEIIHTQQTASGGGKEVDMKDTSKFYQYVETVKLHSMRPGTFGDMEIQAARETSMKRHKSIMKTTQLDALP